MNFDMTSVFARTPFWLERENGLRGEKNKEKSLYEGNGTEAFIFQCGAG